MRMDFYIIQGYRLSALASYQFATHRPSPTRRPERLEVTRRTI